MLVASVMVSGDHQAGRFALGLLAVPGRLPWGKKGAGGVCPATHGPSVCPLTSAHAQAWTRMTWTWLTGARALAALCAPTKEPATLLLRLLANPCQLPNAKIILQVKLLLILQKGHRLRKNTHRLQKGAAPGVPLQSRGRGSPAFT